MIAQRFVLLTALVSPLLLPIAGAQAASLASVNAALQACLDGGRPRACPGAVDAVNALQASAAYGKADPLCRQQIVQFKDVVTLLAVKDTTPLEAQAKFDAVVQTCAKAGF